MNLTCISGALRRASTNTLLLREAAARWQGEVRFAAIAMPLFDEDLEDAQGVPAEAHALADAIEWAGAVLISTPEYNRNLPGVLKNALDWLSRTNRGVLADKPLAIMSAADGFAGGVRSQFSLRHCLTPFRPRVLQGPEVAVMDSRHAFDEAGHLKDPRHVKALDNLLVALKREAGR